MEYIVGVDIGGTGTDCVVMGKDGGLTVGKAFSTPPTYLIDDWVVNIPCNPSYPSIIVSFTISSIVVTPS